ncbi:MAG: hypothetical protein ACQESZ_03240 [Bacteroidota bacterium]
MKKKTTALLLLGLLFVGSVAMSSCRSHSQCPGVYSDNTTEQSANRG